MAEDILIKITDREGTVHEVLAPTDMNLNIMEIVRMYELAPEGTIGICGGMAMCASCQCYVLNSIEIPESYGKITAIFIWVVPPLLSKI